MLRELNGSVATERGRAKARRRRLVKTLFITIFTLLILGGGAGAGYVWYLGNTKPVTTTEVQVPTKPKIVQAAEAPKAKPTGPVGVSVQVLTSPVKPGGNASMTIRTRPDAACSIKVTYKDKQQSTDGGLIPKTADEFGLVQWTWTVESSRPVGTGAAEVTCALGDKSGYVKGDLEVANS